MRIRQIVEAAERGKTLGGFPIKVLNVEHGPMEMPSNMVTIP
jgi:hypothetical protein